MPEIDRPFPTAAHAASVPFRRRRLARAGLLAIAGLALLAGCSNPEDLPTQVEGGHASIGKRLVAQYQCGACHMIPNVPGAGGEAGPSLEHVGQLTYLAGGIPNQPARMVAWLRDPPALKPGTTMPSLGVSEAEARHMAAFLYTLR